MSLGRTVYNALFRRTSTFAVTIIVGAFAFERVFDEGMDNLWENMNRGVSKCFVYKLTITFAVYIVDLNCLDIQF